MSHIVSAIGVVNILVGILYCSRYIVITLIEMSHEMYKYSASAFLEENIWGPYNAPQTEVSSGKRRRRENQGAEWGGVCEGCRLSSRLYGGLGERRELPQLDPGRSPGQKRI